MAAENSDPEFYMLTLSNLPLSSIHFGRSCNSLFRKAIRCLALVQKGSRRPLPALLATGLVGWTLPASGADAADAMGGNVLKQMTLEELLSQDVVSVSRQTEKWGNTASSLFVLTEQSPETTGATRLPELLRLAPNLFVAQSNAAHWGINARGFMRTNAYSNKMLVMIDGRSVYSPFYSNVFWDSQAIFMPDLDQIEVISGPSGVNWGSNAVNGVINIMTKSAHETQGGELFAGIGTEAEAHGGVRYGGTFRETGAYRVYAQRMQFDSTLGAGGIDDDFDPWDFSQAGFRVDWGHPADGQFTVQGDVFQGEYTNGDALPPVKVDGANLLARWARNLGDGSDIWVRLYHDYYKRDANTFFVNHTHTTDLEFQHNLALRPGQKFHWGANYRHIDDNMGETMGFAILPEHLKYHLASIFGQHQIQFADETLQWTTGLRIEDNHFSGLELLPSVRLAWRPNPDQTAWVAVSRSVRIPDRLDTGFHYSLVPPHDAEPWAIAGGPNFDSEELIAYELGWRTRPLSEISVTTTLFFHDYNNLRSVEPSDPLIIANEVGGRSYGVELFMNWDVAAWWRIRFGGTYIEQDTWLEPGGADLEQGKGEISFPQYHVQLRSAFQLNDTMRLWLGLRHVDEVPAFENNQEGMIPAYTELDASLHWQARPGLGFSLTGRNLLDRSHPEIGLPSVAREIERSVQLLARLSF